MRPVVNPLAIRCEGSRRVEVIAVVNILLVYPRNPDTFWSFRHVLKFVSKKCAFPPLGLLTVAAMLPPSWTLRLVDLNVCALTDDQIRESDYVFLSGMIVHKQSAHEIAARCSSGSRPHRPKVWRSVARRRTASAIWPVR